mgnify:CR=1 FL=1
MENLIVNLVDMLSRQAGQRPDAPALILPGSVVSYGELDVRVWKAATGLCRRGVQPGDVVALTFRNPFALLVAMLATARIGATVFSVPETLPTLLRAESTQRVGADVLLTDIANAGTAGLKTIHFDLEIFTGDAVPMNPDVRDAAPQAPFMVITGSGSTGKAKVFAITHGQFQARAALMAGSIELSPFDRLMQASSLDYTSPKERAVAALQTGATIMLFSGDRCSPIDLCQRHRVTVMDVTVFHLESLLAALPGDAVEVLPTLRVLQVSASTVSDGLRQRVKKAICRSLYVRYGTNESGLISLARPGDAREHAGTVGRPWPGVQVEVVDSNGQVLAPGVTGYIRVKSPGMIDGYLGDPHASREAFREGWFYPGDLCALRQDGRRCHRGRADQMMIMNGINIYPAEIEHALAQHPAVRDVAVLALRSDIHQDIPVCAVTLDPRQRVGASDLVFFAKQRLGARAPKAVAILETIPRTAQGKLLRAPLADAVVAALRSQATADSAAPVLAPTTDDPDRLQ